MDEHRYLNNIIRTLARSWIHFPVLLLFLHLNSSQDVRNDPSTAPDYMSLSNLSLQRKKSFLTNDSNKYPIKVLPLTGLVHMPWPTSTKGKGLGIDRFTCTTWWEESLKEMSRSTTRRRNRQLNGPRQERILTHAIIWIRIMQDRNTTLWKKTKKPRVQSIWALDEWGWIHTTSAVTLGMLLQLSASAFSAVKWR